MPLRRVLPIAVLVALAGAPLAARADTPPAGTGQEGEHRFPMAAADFRPMIAQRIDRHRTRMEAHIVERQLPKERADELRAKFNAGVTQINAKVDAVCADGTVTRDEAQDVRDLVHSLLRHHAEEQK
jgi:hypothetical protein